MRWLLGLACVAMATALVADQRRGKLEMGEDGWFDFNARDPTRSELARSTIWSHDTWAFALGIGVPAAIAVASLARR